VSARLAPGREVRADSAYLYQIIETIGSGPDLGTILRGIVRLVTEATRCHACFIYFVQDDRLILRAASSIYAHLEGKITLPIGKGLTGWVTSKRRPAFIRDEAFEDPRTLYVPELDEDQFQSLASVPVFGRSGEVIGAITLHAEAPHEFNRSDLDFLEHTASLVAGAIENARLYEVATEKVGILTELADLARSVASTTTLDELLLLVSDRTRHLLAARRCEIFLFDTPTRLILAAASPARAGARPVDAQHLWLKAVEAGLTDLAQSQALAESIWGSHLDGSPLVVPLVAGDERLGLLCVLAEQPSPDSHSVLVAVASHTAIAIKRHQLIDSLKERNLVKDFFEALSRSSGNPDDLAAMAARLKCDLDSRQVVLHAMPWTPPSPRTERGRRTKSVAPSEADWSQVAGRIETRLRAELPAVIFDRRDRSVRALLRVLPTDAGEVADLVGRVYEQAGGSGSGPLAVGLSNVCQGAATFARGFEEAASAAVTGSLLKGTGGVFTYESLGPYRYLLSGEDSVRDRYQVRIQRLVEYDQRRDTELMKTLEGYLEHQGNMVRTARVLYMHPNTLRQRLARIARVAGLDLDHEDWLSLAMAIKAVKLRRLRASVTDEQRREEHGNDS
jgi:GAF domain-containing protein